MGSGTFSINVGPLTGIGSLSMHVGRRLHEFNFLFRRGSPPDLVWDLSHVEPRHMSMAGLTAFLALAQRLRQFTGHASPAQIRWDPDVLAFWDDIGLLDIADQHDLFVWPRGVMGGYTRGIGNPYTKILVFAFSDAEVPGVTDPSATEAWKNWKRDLVQEDISLRCGSLFRHRTGMREFPERVRVHVAMTTAELVENALLHGRSPAFVGLQRSPVGVTATVCDSGCGFRDSIRHRLDQSGDTLVTDMEALLIGSLINREGFGLRRAIDNVVDRDGWVVLSSFGAEVRWRPRLWAAALRACMQAGLPWTSSIRSLIQGAEGSTRSVDYSSGYCRQWQHGLRGARVSFEIPLRPEHGRE